MPEIYDEVERPSRVKLSYQNYQGDLIEEDAEGLFQPSASSMRWTTWTGSCSSTTCHG